VAFLLFFQFPGRAQESIEGSYSFGSVLVHAPDIEPISSHPLNGFAITYTTKNKFGEDWKKNYNYANYGFIYKYRTFNYPEVLGDAHSLTTFLQIPFLKKRTVFDLGCKAQVGLAYLSKIYDEETNPLNAAISTHINISGELQFYTKLRLEPVFFTYAFGLNHYSNGMVKAPNLGINSLNHEFSIGLELEKPVDYFSTLKIQDDAFSKNEFWMYSAMGLKAVKNSTEDNFTFLNVSLNYSRQISRINKLGLGVDYVNDRAATEYAVKNYSYDGTEKLGRRFGPNLQTEFLFGRTSFTAAYGFYLGSTENYSSRTYYKVGGKVHFNNFFALLQLRAIPLFRAEAFLLGIGYRIKGKVDNI